MRNFLSVFLLFAAATLSAAAPATPSFVGDWEFVAVRDGKEDKNWPRAVMTVSADGSCVTRAPRGADFEVVRGKWRQKGNDVWITDSDGEHRARFDKPGRLKIVTDGKEQEFLRGYEFFLRRVTAASTAPSFVGTWEKLIGEKGCLVSASDVKCSLEGSVFAKADWQAFFKAAKKDEQSFRFVLSQFSSRKPTEIHICNFRNATEGEVAVFAVQRIVGANWYDYDGHDKELKKIIGTETAAKVQLLKQVLENDGLCASLQRYFFRKYVTTLRLDEFRAKAEKGDAAAQLELGMRLLYANGGVAKDPAALPKQHVTANIRPDSRNFFIQSSFVARRFSSVFPSGTSSRKRSYFRKPLTPSKITCAASATMYMPVNLLRIRTPWSFSIRLIASEKKSVTPMPMPAKTAIASSVPMKIHLLQCISSDRAVTLAPITSSVPMVPGPTVVGMASGTTAGSLLSASCVRFFGVLLRTMSIPLSIRTNPAPTRNALSEMPSMSKMTCPKTYSTATAQTTAKPVRRASLRRSASSMPSVVLTKTERTKNGVSRRNSLTARPTM